MKIKFFKPPIDIKRIKRIAWNEAIKRATNEMFKYDGLIPNEEDRKYIRDTIRTKLSYKRL